MRKGQSSHSCCVGSTRRTYATTSSSVNEHSPLPKIKSSSVWPSIIRSQWLHTEPWVGREIHWYMWYTGLSSRVVNETKKKLARTNWDPKTCCPVQSTSSRTKAKVSGTKDLLKKLVIGKYHYKPRKKGMREGMDPSLSIKKETSLTSHFATMDFAIQGEGNRVIPRQRFGQMGHLICLAPPKQGSQTRLADGKVPERFQQVEEDHKMHGRENEIFQGLDHSD